MKNHDDGEWGIQNAEYGIEKPLRIPHSAFRIRRVP
jgi:hypothetical protein